MSTSVGFDFLDALEALFNARAGLAGVQVAAANPGKRLASEAIVMLGYESEQEWAAIGRQRRDQTVSVATSIYVEQEGTTLAVAKACRLRIKALTVEIENALRGDPTVGGLVRVAAFMDGALEQGYSDRARWAELMAHISCQARI